MRYRSGAALVLLVVGLAACGKNDVGAGSVVSASYFEDERAIELELGICADAEVTEVVETTTEVVLPLEVAEASDDDARAGGALAHLSQPLGDRRVLVEGANGSTEIVVYRGEAGGGPPPTTNLSELLTP